MSRDTGKNGHAWLAATTLVGLHALTSPERAGLLKPCPVNFLVVPSSAAATTDAFAGVFFLQVL